MDTHFDVLILGTGLAESVTAAALSKAGYKIAHIDENSYYGADEASLSLDEFIKWANDRSLKNSEIESISPYMTSQRSRFTSITYTTPNLPSLRGYSLSLSPSIIPATGPLIVSLISSGVSRYGTFRLLGHLGVYDPSGVVKSVPESKEHIFKNKGISLLDKRRLMRFLLFAAGEFEGTDELAGREEVPFSTFLHDIFSLNGDAAAAIVFALSFCTSLSETTLPALKRLRRYLRSAGRYGTSPFLIGQYGGAGEIAQGFCRASAVCGGVYILGHRISSITSVPSHQSLGPESLPSGYVVTLSDLPDPVTCKLIISSSDYVPPGFRPTVVLPPAPPVNDIIMIARCIAIIDRPLSFVPLPPSSSESDATPKSQQGLETSILVFPPSSLDGGSSTISAIVLLTGEDSMSAPEGKWILYISMPILDPTITPESLLGPYLNATLSLSSPVHATSQIQPLFTAFYIQHFPQSIPAASDSNMFTTSLPSHLLSESLDTAVINAEAVFWRAVEFIKRSCSHTEKAEGQSGEDIHNIDSFWPALDIDLDEDPEEW